MSWKHDSICPCKNYILFCICSLFITTINLNLFITLSFKAILFIYLKQKRIIAFDLLGMSAIL